MQRMDGVALGAEMKETLGVWWEFDRREESNTTRPFLTCRDRYLDLDMLDMINTLRSSY